MASTEEDRPRSTGFTIGEDLSTLSIHELENRIAELEGEIDRIRRMLTAKTAQKAAAD